MNQIELLQNPEQQIDLMLHSVQYIRSRLETFYNTTKEREDIERNKQYLELMISKTFILNKISPDILADIRLCIDEASTALTYNND